MLRKSWKERVSSILHTILLLKLKAGLGVSMTMTYRQRKWNLSAYFIACNRKKHHRKRTITPKHKTMSVTKIIDEEDITLVQGVNGILLHKEGWIKEKEKAPSSLCINSCIFLPITIVSIFIVKKKEKRQENTPCEA